ncbi:hypothetical protein ACFLS7_04995 [Bacteroidota bacterium]
MNRSLRKSSRYLIFPILFVASLAFAYEVILPRLSADKSPSLSPDSTYSAPPASSDSTYQKLLVSISDLFSQERYEECLVQLKRANELKPNVRSVQERMIRVEGLIAQQKKTREEYTRLISMADSYFAQKDYLNAKASYQMAIDLKPSDAYARERMNKTMELLRSNKAQNILYDVTLASADKLFAAGNYDKAMSQYENASSILPGEAYPKEKINAIIKLLVDQQVREELYQQAIGAADKYYASTSYQRALLEYQKALQQKPTEPYPQERIDELTKILADLAALEKAYKEAIALADQLFAETSYTDARSGYEEALALKPKEGYPVEKIKEIDAILARIAKNNADFEKFVNLADSFYMDKNFIRARQNYQLALQIKPNESYPKAMLAKTTDGVGTQQANELAMEEAYNSAIASADKLFAENALAEAKAEYENALAYKPEEIYPQQKIEEIGTLLAAAIAQQKALDEQYNSIVENADRLFSDNLYPQSREQYEAALKLKPDETYPAGKILELDGILANLEEQKAKDARYKSVLAEADKLFTTQSYEPAKAEYLKALDIKPSESFPAERILTIDSILFAIANTEAIEKHYIELIALADDEMGNGNYPGAKAVYQEALSLKPTESYPEGKIREIDAILSSLAQEAEREANYALAIAKGDSLLENEAYQPSKAAYQSALTLKPGESYPSSKITEIDGILAERARLQSLSQQYDEAIANADQLFADSAWQQARGAYVQAQSLKPEEVYPGQQLTLIDEKLAEIARLLALEQENQKALEEKYAGLISSSDNLFADKDYQAAKTGYNQALSLKPTESYPASKVTEIDAILAEIARIEALELQYAQTIARGDSLFSAALLIPARVEFESALTLKPDAPYPKEKLTEIEAALQEIASQQALDERYLAEVASADKLFAGSSWDPAIAGYKRALELKPAEEYPAQKISEIDSIKQEIARLLALDQEYQRTMLIGERQLSETAYDSARITFSEAQTLKPAESLPGEKIAQIDSILLAIANQKALDERYAELVDSGNSLFGKSDYEAARLEFSEAASLKPEESYPKEKIGEIDGILAEIARVAALEAAYAQAIVNGDSLLAADLLVEARGEFEKASGLKPEEAYPKTKLTEIDNALQDIARLKALDEQYQGEIATGDRLFAEKSWDPAIAAYQKALEIKPKEVYPIQKIAEIDSVTQEIARQLKIDNDYALLITQGDQLFSSKSLDSARMTYARAGELRPEKSYWQEQVAEIDRIQAEIKRVNDEYQAAISSADLLLSEQRYEEAKTGYQDASLIKPEETYPKEKIKEINKRLAEIEGLRQAFDRLVMNGDRLFSGREFYKAKDNFEQALDLFPDEAHPREQLRLTNVKIDSLFRANKADYDKAVGDGDRFFNTFEYDKAIDAYSRAIAFLPNEDYPRQMIYKIRKTIAENAIADVLSTPVIVKAGDEKKFSFDPVNISSRRNNFIYLKVRNLSNKSFNIFIRYGNGDQTNGGLSIRNITLDGEINERLISVKDQDPWYREDNNWISLYPQGGDIEVSFIQVSRAIN